MAAAVIKDVLATGGCLVHGCDVMVVAMTDAKQGSGEQLVHVFLGVGR